MDPIKILLLMLVSFELSAAKPFLDPQKRKTQIKSFQIRTIDNAVPEPKDETRSFLKDETVSVEKPEEKRALYNDIRTKYVVEEDDEDEYRESRMSSTKADFSDMGGDLKTVMKKHHFIIGETPYSIQGIPIVYTSKSTGFNLGTRISLTNLEYDRPYTYKISLQYWSSDRGSKNHEIALDVPKFFSSNWHFRASYKYPKIITQEYFGIGNNSVYDHSLSDPKAVSFMSRTYYQYIFTHPRFSFDLEYLIPDTNFSIYTGLSLDSAKIAPHNNNSSSMIFSEQPYGYQGGKTNYIKAGIKYDSRDYPFNPRTGLTFALTYTNHATSIDSDYKYSNIDLVYMGFFSMLRYFTLSHRIMIDQAWGDIPFFGLSQFRSYNDYEGLGGADLLRGAPAYRYIDNLKMVSQLELRTRFYYGKVFGQLLMVHFNPYWDMGRVWDRNKKLTFGDFHHSFGNEFRFTWNDNFIMSFTVGRSTDGTSTYLTFGENFI